MKSKYHFQEKTLDIKYGDITVRLWIDINDDKKIDTKNIIDIIIKFLSNNNSEEEIIEFICKTVQHLTALQVISEDISKNAKVGTVVYTVPFEDIHG